MDFHGFPHLNHMTPPWNPTILNRHRREEVSRVPVDAWLSAGSDASPTAGSGELGSGWGRPGENHMVKQQMGVSQWLMAIIKWL